MCLLEISAKEHFHTFLQVVAASSLKPFRFQNTLFLFISVNLPDALKVHDAGSTSFLLPFTVAACLQAIALFSLKKNSKGCFNASLSAISNCANGDLFIIFSKRKWQLNSMRQCSRP